MRTRRLIAALALVAGAAAIFFWISGDDSGAKRSAEPDTDQEAPAQAPLRSSPFPGWAANDAPDAGGPAKKRSAAAEEDRAKRKVHIRGIVLENRAPASDATVRLQDDYEGPGATTRSGSDGRFEIDIAARYIIRLDAVKGDNLRGSAQVLLARGPPKEVRIELKRASAVVVTVTSQREKGPVSGARVSAVLKPESVNYDPLLAGEHEQAERRFGPVQTDAEGRATLFMLRAGKYEIEARHDRLGQVIRDQPLQMTTATQELALEIPAGSAISGRLLTDAKEPIPDAELSLTPEKRGTFGYHRTKTDAEGRFRFEGIAAGRFSLDAHPARYVPRTIPIEKKDDLNDVEVEVVLDSGGTIAGRVLDARQAPAAGWKVIATLESSQQAYVRRTAVSQKDGSFAVEGCPSGTYAMSLARASEETAPVAPREDRVRASPGDGDVVLQAREGAAIEGRVHFEGGDPPETYVVSVRARQIEEDGAPSTFTVGDLSPGRAQVSVNAEGFAAASESVTLKEGATTNVSLTLRRATRVSGRVIDRDGPPIENAVVRSAARPGAVDDQVAAARTGPDGSFVLEGVAPGKIELIARADSYVTEVAGPFDAGAETAPITLKLRRGVRVSGRVRTGPRAPQSGSVTLYPTSDRGRDWRQTRSTALGEGGTFVIDGVAPGKNELQVQARFEDVGKSKRISVDVPAAGLPSLDVDFAAAAPTDVRATAPAPARAPPPSPPPSR